LKKIFLFLIYAAAALLSASPAHAKDAADPVLIGNYGGKSGWNAYHFQDKAGEVCFMSRMPEKQEGKFKKRGPVLFFVTHWSGKDANVVSVVNGYDFKPGSPVTLAIKGKKFALSALGDKAWTKDQTQDSAVIKELTAGASMTVRGASSRGTSTTDTYSLKGSAEALRAIARECGDKK
jgi:hypothetical protein